MYETIEMLGYGSYYQLIWAADSTLRLLYGCYFQRYIYEIGEEIVSGGRCDELIGNFGEMLPAVGLASTSKSNCEGAARAARTI